MSLDVSMDDISVVEIEYGLECLFEYRLGFLKRQRILLLDIVGDGGRTTIFQHEVYLSQSLCVFVQFYNVWMLQIRHNVNLFTYVAKLGWLTVHFKLFIHFYGETFLWVGLPSGQVDCAVGALAELVDQLVLS